MRLAIVTLMNDSPWGGSEFLWASISTLARNEGHDVGVWHPGQLAGPKVEELKEAGVAFYAIASHSSAKRWVQWGQRFLGLKPRSWFPPATLLSWRPDVVVFNEGILFQSIRASSILRWCCDQGIPTVIATHSNSEHLPPLAVRQLTELRDFFENAALILLVSQPIWDRATRQLCRSLEQARIFRNPVNLVRRECLPWPEDAPLRLAFVGRLDCQSKALDLLLDALNRVHWRDESWVLEFVGEGKDKDHLRELVEFFGLQSKVIFRGHEHDIASVWRRCHLLVLMSHNEGMPLTLVEAMICGRPAVVTDVGDVRHLVVEGENGFLAPSSRREQMVEALERAWSARADWKDMGLRAHESASGFLHPDPVNEVWEWIQEAVGKRLSPN